MLVASPTQPPIPPHPVMSPLQCCYQDILHTVGKGLKAFAVPQSTVKHACTHQWL